MAFKLIAVVVLGAMGTLVQATWDEQLSIPSYDSEPRLFGGDHGKVNLCPNGGVEKKYPYESTTRARGYAISSCNALCADWDRENVVGSEHFGFADKLFCCCKTKSAGDSSSSSGNINTETARAPKACVKGVQREYPHIFMETDRRSAEATCKYHCRKNGGNNIVGTEDFGEDKKLYCCCDQ